MDEAEGTVAAAGEFGLIERIRSIVGPSAARVGIGDDTAVLEGAPGECLLATVDMLVQDVHFRVRPGGGTAVGRRVFEVSASDIASMGGTPTFALVSLATSPDMPLAYLEDVFGGIGQAASGSGASIVGGNVTRIHGPLVIDLTLLGRVATTEVILRSGARPGDVLAVTGSLGDAAAARLAFERGLVSADRAMSDWSERSSAPTARVAEGRALASGHFVSAMIDLSDGLSSDLAHLCSASGVGAVIEEHRVPISPETAAVAGALGLSRLDLAVSGGEDYELLAALPARKLGEAARALGGALIAIGEVVGRDEGITLRREDGSLVPLAPAGWRHF